jgi:hypothetical protein
MAKARRTKELTGRDFDALPAAEKERIFQELENLTAPQARRMFRPMTPKEKRDYVRRTSASAHRKGGRPRLGKSGTAVISVRGEKSLLKAVNAYAKASGIKRSELVTAALRSVIGKTA